MTEGTEGLPLSGISVLVTRSRDQSEGLVESLSAMGADVTVIPTVSFRALPSPEGFDQVLSRAASYDHLVFTSANGVKFFLERIEGSGILPGNLPPAVCVGKKTADAWERAGGAVSHIPERFTAADLLAALEEDLPGRALLIVRPEVVSTDLTGCMRDRGARVDEAVLYRTVVPEESRQDLDDLLAAGRLDALFFASPSAVNGIMTLVPDPGKILDIPAVCIGPTTAQAAEEAGFSEVYFPDEHRAGAMVDELAVIAGRIRESRVQSPESGE